MTDDRYGRGYRGMGDRDRERGPDRERDGYGGMGGRAHRDYDRDDRSYGSSGYGDHDRDQDYGRGRDNDRYGKYYGKYDDDRRVAIDETDRLIASNKVEGTRVYDRRGARLGYIENFMVDKRTGKAEYAVLSFGGFLGMGGRHYPLPWDQLTYDDRQGGYVVDITERDLERAPSHRAGEDARYDRRYSSDIYGYYGQRY